MALPYESKLIKLQAASAGRGNVLSLHQTYIKQQVAISSKDASSLGRKTHQTNIAGMCPGSCWQRLKAPHQFPPRLASCQAPQALRSPLPMPMFAPNALRMYDWKPALVIEKTGAKEAAG